MKSVKTVCVTDSEAVSCDCLGQLSLLSIRGAERVRSMAERQISLSADKHLDVT